jgi:hypothetical protein
MATTNITATPMTVRPSLIIFLIRRDIVPFLFWSIGLLGLLA